MGMPEKKSRWRFLEWFGRAHAIHAILQTEFVRTWLLPLLSSVLTGTSGAIGGIPLMWVMMASAIVFAAVTLGSMGALGLRVQTSPQNKLAYKTVFHCDFTPREMPLIGNRHQRRG